jgi:hypothetical protein
MQDPEKAGKRGKKTFTELHLNKQASDRESDSVSSEDNYHRIPDRIQLKVEACLQPQKNI